MREGATLALVETPKAPAAAHASGSSFYAAMRILPRAQREAMFEIYSFCRLVDDIADSDGPRGERLDALQRWRDDVTAIYAGNPPPHLNNLAKAARDFSLRREDFIAVIDGMEMDVLGDIQAPELAMLDLYCDRVASAVGRLSVRVFGMSEQDGIALAHHLGRALQLTNILRDLDEDAEIRRLYLPREALQEAGITATNPASVLAEPSLGTACARVVEKARGHFAEAEKIMARSPRKTVRAPMIMAEVYRGILEGMAARGWSPPRERIRVPKTRLAWIVLRNAIV